MTDEDLQKAIDAAHSQLLYVTESNPLKRWWRGWCLDQDDSGYTHLESLRRIQLERALPVTETTPGVASDD